MRAACFLPDGQAETPRFIVAQIGARRGYAVPAVLEQAGLLEGLYTDICGDISWGRQIARARFVPGLRSRVLRLAGRRLPAAIRSRTRTFARPVCQHAWRAVRAQYDAAAAFQLVGDGGELAGEGGQGEVPLGEVAPVDAASFHLGERGVDLGDGGVPDRPYPVAFRQQRSALPGGRAADRSKAVVVVTPAL